MPTGPAGYPTGSPIPVPSSTGLLPADSALPSFTLPASEAGEVPSSTALPIEETSSAASSSASSAAPSETGSYGYGYKKRFGFF
jgi:hypothetical protein